MDEHREQPPQPVPMRDADGLRYFSGGGGDAARGQRKPVPAYSRKSLSSTSTGMAPA